MCLVPLECVCLLCKFGAFSEILGIKISKFSRGSIPPDPARNRSAKLIAILPRLKFYPGYVPEPPALPPPQKGKSSIVKALMTHNILLSN